MRCPTARSAEGCSFADVLLVHRNVDTRHPLRLYRPTIRLSAVDRWLGGAGSGRHRRELAFGTELVEFRRCGADCCHGDDNREEAGTTAATGASNWVPAAFRIWWVMEYN